MVRPFSWTLYNARHTHIGEHKIAQKLTAPQENKRRKRELRLAHARGHAELNNKRNKNSKMQQTQQTWRPTPDPGNTRRISTFLFRTLDSKSASSVYTYNIVTQGGHARTHTHTQ